jgi:hypothetical protein
MAYGAPNDRLAGTWAGPGWRFWWFNIDGLQRYESDRATWTYFGTDADTPISGAWGAGEGGYIEKIGTFRNGEWRLDMNANGVWNAGVDRVVTGFGGAGSIPVPGRYTGGSDRIGVFGGGYWFIDYDNSFSWSSGDVATMFLSYQNGDTPVVGDWIGDGVERIGIFRGGYWMLDLNGDWVWGSGDSTFYFNPAPGGQPLVADFRNIGKPQLAMFKNRRLYIDWNGNGRWDGSGGDRTYDTLHDSSQQVLAGKWQRHMPLAAGYYE